MAPGPDSPTDDRDSKEGKGEPVGDGNSSERESPSPDEVYDAMEPFEPYTTAELASLLDIPRQAIRRLLATLTSDERIRKKEPDPDRPIWIREPPAYTCPNCGREFEIKYLHPVLSSVRFCPRCGTQLG